jgi:hypothetical protein
MASTITADSGAVSGSAGLKSSADSSGVLALATGTGTTAVTIDASQNVGIGTSSPSTQLAVQSTGAHGVAILQDKGTAALSSRLFFQASGGTFAMLNNTNSLAFTYGASVGSSTGTEAMRIDSSGNVGIGTASPAAKLNTSGSSAAGYVGNYFDNTASNGYVRLDLRIGSNGANGTASVKYAPGVFMAIGPDSNDTTTPLVFLTNNATERARIDSSGNLLVGTTSSNVFSPNNGIALLPSSSTSGGATISIGHASGTSNGYSYTVFNYAGGAIGSISQNGTTAVAYNTTSDYRLKENVQPLSGALSRVAQLKPCTYTWKSAPDEIGEGFIAHELAEVCPQAVTGEKDAVNEDGSIKAQSIDTSFLVATLTAAIQELKAINDTQAQTITTLTERITALENK